MRVPKAEVERRLETFKTACRAGGVKLTPQRTVIFREIASRLDHPDADAIHRAVARQLPTTSLDTVYRTLATMETLGLIVPLAPRHAGARFDANLERHHHFVCTHCGLVRDFASPRLDTLETPDEVAAFGTVLSTQVEVRGVCAKCERVRAGKPV